MVEGRGMVESFQAFRDALRDERRSTGRDQAAPGGSEMTGRERIAALLAGQPADRPPFVPAVYEHKAALIGVDALGRGPQRHAPGAGPVPGARDLRAGRADRRAATSITSRPKPPGPGSGSSTDRTSRSIEERLLQPGQDVGFLPLPDPERSGRMPVFLEAGRRLQAHAGDGRPRPRRLSAPFSMAAELVGDEPLLIGPDGSAGLGRLAPGFLRRGDRGLRQGLRRPRAGGHAVRFPRRAAARLAGALPARSSCRRPPGSIVLLPGRARRPPGPVYHRRRYRPRFWPASWRPGPTTSSAISRPTWPAFVDRVTDPAVLVRANLDPRFLLEASDRRKSRPARRSSCRSVPPPRLHARDGDPALSISRRRKSWPSGGPWSEPPRPAPA